MKRRDLIRHLIEQGCELVREGGRHSWWRHGEKNSRSAVPRHSEIADVLAKKICKDRRIDPPG
jgi:mRNA interferase HicA